MTEPGDKTLKENDRTTSETGSEAGLLSLTPELPKGWLHDWPWATFLLPMIVFMLIGSFEPKPPETGPTERGGVESEVDSEVTDGWDDTFFEEDDGFLPTIAYRHYPIVYSVKIFCTLLAMVIVWPGYRTFRWHVNPLAIGVGIVGVVLWIGLCHLGLEAKIFKPIGLGVIVAQGERSAFNPLVEMANTPLWAYLFLAIRFLGLAVIVPIFEEFFLRGFLMRFVMSDSWWKVPFGTATRTALVIGTLFPMLMHPGELLAAMIWFSLVTWMMLRTRNIWDCVVAHATTNLLLGIYVVTADQWQLM
jgi:CAAX prenyl protease-like protein